jgi:3,5-epimerase/4-reductase
MKFLILGHKGWIGSMMCRILDEKAIPYIVTDIRPNDKEAFEAMLLTESPTHVMSFIGRTHGTIGDTVYPTIDYLEQPGKLVENVRDNLFSPVVTALLCQKYGIHYTYLGTGCIFKFDDTHLCADETTGFKEADLPNFVGSSYSIVKGYTDELMHLLDSTVLNLRIRMPITSKEEPRNFITKITHYERVCSIPNSMTVLDELLPYALDMACKKRTGTVNLTNPGLISHNEILDMYRNYVDPSFTWKNFTQEEQRKVIAADRSNNCLDTSLLTSYYPEIKHIRDSVADILKRFERYPPA